MTDSTPAIRAHCDTLCQLLTERYRTVWSKPASYFTAEKNRYIRVMCDPPNATEYHWGASVDKRTGDVFYDADRKKARFNLLDDGSREFLFDHADPGGWCLYAEHYRARFGRTKLHNYRV